MNKLQKLSEILKEMRSVLVAFSGGVDSALLCAVAKKALGDKVLAVTAVSETYTKSELKDSKKTAELFKIKHKIISTDELRDASFAKNPPDRCFYCKSELFSRLRRIAKKNGIRFVADASNLDDLKDYRPGAKAKKMLGVRSPLQEAGFTKKDIRKYSKKMGLPAWNKPAMACLASRFAYGEKITKEKLHDIESAENFLKKFGFKQVRVRSHGHIARIEVEKTGIKKIFQGDIIKLLVKNLGKAGYKYVTLDLMGFRSGSMNEML